MSNDFEHLFFNIFNVHRELDQYKFKMAATVSALLRSWDLPDLIDNMREHGVSVETLRFLSVDDPFINTPLDINDDASLNVEVVKKSKNNNLREENLDEDEDSNDDDLDFGDVIMETEEDHEQNYLKELKTMLTGLEETIGKHSKWKALS
ncbi:hypothetical protein TKK_0010691 [Trichogramma kaykai]